MIRPVAAAALMVMSIHGAWAGAVTAGAPATVPAAAPASTIPVAIPAAAEALSGTALFGPESAPVAGKYLHFLAGMAAGFEAAGIFECVYGPGVMTQSILFSPIAALSGSALAGVAKEVLDSTGFGDPRLTDVLITMAGGLAAAMAVLFAHAILPPTSDGWAGSQAYLQTSAALLVIPVAAGFIVEIERNRTRRAQQRP